MKEKISSKPISSKNQDAKKEEKYLKTGVEGFDTLLEYGIPVNSSVIVEGGPGSGKTIFCLQTGFNACNKGKKVLFMSFEEPEDRLIEHMKEFGWDPDPLIEKDLMRVKRFSALDIARSVEALLSEAKRELLIDIQPVFFPHDFTPDIVMIDSLTSISSAFSGQESRFRVYMEQLFRYLESQKITSFLIRESANPVHLGRSGSSKGEAVSFLSDGIIIIYNVLYEDGRRGSAIEILKMRGAKIDKRIVEMEITKKGIKVDPRDLGEHHKLNYHLS